MTSIGLTFANARACTLLAQVMFTTHSGLRMHAIVLVAKEQLRPCLKCPSALVTQLRAWLLPVLQVFHGAAASLEPLPACWPPRCQHRLLSRVDGWRDQAVDCNVP